MKFKFFLLIIVLPLLLTGCYDQNELDNLAYVVAIGVDTGEGENLNLTYQIAIPLNMAGESSNAGKENFTTYTVSAPSLYTANSIVNSITTKEVDLSHIKIIIYSEEFAKSDLTGHINSFVSNVDIRPKTAVAICKGKAEDFLKEVAPLLEASPARYYDLMLSSYEYTSESTQTDLIKFYAACQSYDREAIADIAENFSKDEIKQYGNRETSGSISNGSINEEDETSSNSESSTGSSGGEESEGSSNGKQSDSNSEKDTRFAGLAVFSGAKMVGEIPPDLVLAHLILINNLKKGTITVKDIKYPNKLVSVTLKTNNNTKFDVTVDGDTPKVKIKIYLDAQFQSSGTITNYLDDKNKQILKKYIEEKINSIIKEYLDKTIELGSDIAGIGRYAKINYLTWKEFEDSNWLSNYKNLEYEISTNINLDVSRIIFHRLPNN